MSYATARQRGANSQLNKLYPEDRIIHEWYRFVLSFPPHLVQDYLARWRLNETHRILDPFCGTGTVLVEAKRHGIPSVGIDANPMAYFASKVKIDWTPDPDGLTEHARHVAEIAGKRLADGGIEDVPFFATLQALQQHESIRTLQPETAALLLRDSISPLPLHKAIVLLECLEQHRDERYEAHERLALAKALVFSISNLHFGPEVGVSRPKPDAPVISPWLANVQSMANDLRTIGNRYVATLAEVYCADARQLGQLLPPASIDAVFTSPPYPNEKEYTRATRLESVLLGFLKTKADLQALKRHLLRSNTYTKCV